MGRSLQTRNPLIVSDFHAALLHQLVLVLVLVALCAIGFNVVRTVQYRRLAAQGQPGFPSRPPVAAEAAGRRIVRIGFGLLWLLDGLLQVQSSMPLGLPSGVIEPTAGSSPGWVQHLVQSGLTVWSDHPIQAASAAVWIQLGLGAWLLVAPRGRWSRLAGLAGAAWGLVVWAFGESFGGIFAPGVTWLFGAPGAAVLYVVAGVLVALPERAWATPRLGRVVVRAGGAFLLGMAVLQAWPGRGSWQGRGGTLPAMVRSMAATPQPAFLSSWLQRFASFDAAHGWGVNLFVVVSLAAIGGLFLTGRPRPVLVALVALVVLCLADWVLVEDLGFLGGLGTDPNSMVPMALLFTAGSVALTRVPEGQLAPAAHLDRGDVPWWQRATLGSVAGTAAAVAAVAVVMVGAAPMAMASVNRTVDPVVSEALDGTPNALDTPAPAFTLTDQSGHQVSLASLRGHVVALTFLDPVCTTDCPLIAQEFRRTDALLGSRGARVDFVAVVANPVYRSASYTRAFDQQEGLDHTANWYFLTGPLPDLERVWSAYGELVQILPAGAMVAHNDIAFVIDGHGRERDALVDDPGPTQTTAASFSSLLLSRIDHALGS